MSNSVPTRERLRFRRYLAVPHAERDAAKQAGALWDAERKAWYTTQDTAATRRWQPSPVTLPDDRALRDQFSAVLTELGCRVEAPHPIADLTIDRIILGILISGQWLPPYELAHIFLGGGGVRARRPRPR